MVLTHGKWLNDDYDYDYFLGPTEQNPDDPFVLVGAAHCNFICKDRDSKNILETCCCRDANHPATCYKRVRENSLILNKGNLQNKVKDN